MTATAERRPLSPLVENARELLDQGHTRQQAAWRLGVSVEHLTKSVHMAAKIDALNGPTMVQPAPVSLARDGWRNLAACTGQADLMCGADEDRARRVCAACQALLACREWALGLDADQDPEGVCGGLSEQQRKQWRGET